MADAFDRLQDGAIACSLLEHTGDWFHTAQTLLNHFRELQAAVQHVQDASDQLDPTIGIFLDSSKAFERINPYWIRIQVLHSVRVPQWVILCLRRPPIRSLHS